MSEANKRTIRIVREEAMRKGKLDKLDGLFTDDYVHHGISMLGDLRGPTAFKDLARGFIDAVSEFQETVEDQIAEGDRAPRPAARPQVNIRPRLRHARPHHIGRSPLPSRGGHYWSLGITLAVSAVSGIVPV